LLQSVRIWLQATDKYVAAMRAAAKAPAKATKKKTAVKKTAAISARPLNASGQDAQTARRWMARKRSPRQL
jgi:type IV secretory pathway TrbL component